MSIRTQVYIEEYQLKELKLKAEKIGTSVSALIRKGIDNILKKEKESDTKNDPFYKMIGSISGGVNDSKQLDKVVYHE